MAKEEKSIDLHLVTPMIYKRDEYLGWVTHIEVFYTDELELVSHNGDIYTPCVKWGKREHKDLLVQVKETEEEIRAMVDGELKLVEFKKERKYGKD